MRNRILTNIKKASSLLILLPICACGAAPNSGVDGLPFAHKDVVESFSNNAGACFAPRVEGQKIYCEKLATFAHYTLTFVEPIVLGAQKAKIQYKIRFGEKNEQSCMNHSSIKEESIRIFKSDDNFAHISDMDVQVANDKTTEEIIKNLIDREKKRGEICYKYALFTNDNPMMMYKIKYTSLVHGTQTPPLKPDGDYFSFFSSGTSLEFSR